MNKFYACSDLHGMKELYEKINDFIDDSDIVFFLGDAGDRGTHPWETIKLIRYNPQFAYLKGNHEDMLVKTMKDYIRGVDKYGDGDPRETFRYNKNFQLLAWNGGGPTFYGWIEDGADPEWIAYLENLPEYKLYTNANGKSILLSHAGLTPCPDENNEKSCDLDWYDLLWDRDHLLDDWNKEFENTIVVHGHTPIPSMNKYAWRAPAAVNGVVTYCDGHKINIDNGAFHTQMTTLLDLDTLEGHPFYCDNLLD